MQQYLAHQGSKQDFHHCINFRSSLKLRSPCNCEQLQRPLSRPRSYSQHYICVPQAGKTVPESFTLSRTCLCKHPFAACGVFKFAWQHQLVLSSIKTDSLLFRHRCITALAEQWRQHVKLPIRKVDVYVTLLCTLDPS